MLALAGDFKGERGSIFRVLVCYMETNSTRITCEETGKCVLIEVDKTTEIDRIFFQVGYLFQCVNRVS